MIDQLKNLIDERIDVGGEKWAVYSACKSLIYDYEKKEHFYFYPDEIMEYIHYITDKMGV